MAKSKVMKAIKLLEQCLQENGLDVFKIILFGSQVSGKVTQESDIDVVIISKDFQNKNIFERAALTKDAEIRTIKKFLIPLDVITLTPEEFETSLFSEYAKNGEVVYLS